MQPTQAARHAEGECKAVGRYVQHYNAAVNHYYMKELKNDISVIQYPHGYNYGFEYTNGICPAITISSWQNNNFIKYTVTQTKYLTTKNNTTMELPEELKGKKFRIRKLTPKECFRLMGVDDNDIDRMQASGLSNSAQYKLAGNSIVVDVLYHIFRKLLVETQNEDTQPTLF